MADDEGFLARWSRRKLADNRGEGTPAPAESAPGEPPAEPETVPQHSGTESADPTRHPAEDVDIDSLSRESDFTIFMQKGVPPDVRRRALRKLWTSDPVLANPDELNDFPDFERWPAFTGNIRTAWRAGRGFLTDTELGIEPQETTASAEEGDGEEAPTEEDAGGGEGPAEDEPGPA